MPSLLPPLHTLRAFEAIARCSSFVKAAEEISLTHSAVSHQVRILEDFYQTRLFVRGGREVHLTPAGEKLLPHVVGALDQLRAGTEVLRDEDRVVRVTVLPSFANRWLMRRVGSFIARHPELDVQLFCSQQVEDLRRDNYSVALRYGNGNWAGSVAEKLVSETLFAVVSASAARETSISLLEALQGLPLLRDQYTPWTSYIKAAGWPEKECRFGALYGDSAQLLDAAERGLGIALARSVLVRDSLQEGALARFGTLQLEAPGAYYLVTQRGLGDLPRGAALFCEWLKQKLLES